MCERSRAFRSSVPRHTTCIIILHIAPGTVREQSDSAREQLLIFPGNYASTFECEPFSTPSIAPPDPHGPPKPSDAWSTCADDRAALAEYASRLLSSALDISGSQCLEPSSYLHSAFVVQTDIFCKDVWIAESGALCQTTNNTQTCVM